MNAFITAVSSENAIPIALIEQIIAAIMQIIQQCPTPAPTPAEIKAGSTRWNIAAFRAMIMCGVRFSQRTPLLGSMQKHAANLTDADAAEFLGQCGVTLPE